MSFTHRRKCWLPTRKSGIGGFSSSYVDDSACDEENDSAYNMTMDVLQGNSLNEQPQLPPESTEKTPPKKRKIPMKAPKPKKVKGSSSSSSHSCPSDIFKQFGNLEKLYKK